jgi:hypothetical protein
MKREEKRKEWQDRKERKKMAHLQRELQAASRVESGNVSRLDVRADHVPQDDDDDTDGVTVRRDGRGINDFEKVEALSPVVVSPRKAKHPTRAGLGRILTHFAGGKRVLSSDKLAVTERPSEDDRGGILSRLPFSPSMPSFPTESGFLVGDLAFSGIKTPFLGDAESEDIYALSPDKPKKDREPSNDDYENGWMFP